MDVIPPQPVGTLPGSYFWNDWIEKLRQTINNLSASFTWTNISGTPTTLAGYGITDAQNISQKNVANGYAGLNSVSRITRGVDSGDDLIIDSATDGLVLKDTQATPHYWRVRVNNTGTLVITDLGTTKP
jgi:hypothetical protein